MQRQDAFGDSLPDGVVARFGTRRLKHFGDVHALDYSHDGLLLASADTSGTAMVWKTGDAALEGYDNDYEHGIFTLAFAPGSHVLAVGSGGGTLRLIDVDEKSVMHTTIAHGEGAAINEVALSPDGTLVATASDDLTVALWQVADGAAVGRIQGGEGASMWAVRFHPDGRELVTGDSQGQVRIWMLSDLEQARATIEYGGAYVNSVDVSPDGKLLAAAGEGGLVRVWRWEDAQELASLDTDEDEVVQVRFAPEGKRVGALTESSLRIWKIEGAEDLGQVLLDLDKHRGFAWAPDGKHVALGIDRAPIRVVELATGKQLLEDRRHVAAVTKAIQSADGTLTVTAGGDGRVILWDTATSSPRHLIHAAQWEVADLALSPDAATLAVVTKGPPRLLVFDTATGKARYQRKVGNGRVAIAFSPDGESIAHYGLPPLGLSRGARKPTVQLFAAADGKPGVKFVAGVHCRGLAFTPDGKSLVTGGVDGKVRVWDLEALAETLVLTLDQPSCAGIALSADGARVAAFSVESRGEDEEAVDWSHLRVWDLATGELELERATEGEHPTAIALSPDGAILAIARTDARVVLMDIASKESFASLSGHDDSVSTLTFSPDGHRLLSASRDTTALLSEVPAFTPALPDPDDSPEAPFEGEDHDQDK